MSTVPTSFQVPGGPFSSAGRGAMVDWMGKRECECC